MKHSPFITVAFVLMIAANANAQVTDRIVLGNDNSEKSHGLTMYCPDNVAITTNGLSGETGRRSLMFTANPFSCEYPDIYGGEFSFVLRVDPERQNYITLRTNGGDGVKENERYRVMVENKDLTNYSASAVTFSETKAPGAFAFNTLLIPLAITKGKTNVVVRVRSAGRYYGYGTPSVFTTYQRKMTCDMPPIYDVYSSTNPVFSIKGEKVGQMADYTKAPEKSNVNLPALKKAVLETLEEAMKKQYNSADFKPAYGNNNFNVIECMAVGYRHGYYGGTTSSKMANKIRIALDSMVYINNLVKKGVDVKVSAIGSSATTQKASSGWGGLYGEQGFAVYILRKAGQLTDDRKISVFLTDQVPGYSTIVVSDNGPGFNIGTDVAIQPFISGKPNNVGMGLGLHIANEMMNAMKGCLMFYDEQDITLPKEVVEAGANKAIVALCFPKGE